jgi:hypothetical protein
LSYKIEKPEAMKTLPAFIYGFKRASSALGKAYRNRGF